jgi:hypothetical protein
MKPIAIGGFGIGDYPSPSRQYCFNTVNWYQNEAANPSSFYGIKIWAKVSLDPVYYGVLDVWMGPIYLRIHHRGGGCPILYVWDGADYGCEGLLDIHNPEGVDLVYEHTLAATPQRVGGAYLFRLTEHPKTHSYIDQVKLYAMLQDGTTKELPLIWAWHSEDGNVLPTLLHSDERKTDTLGADHNDGTSQSVDLKFAALSPNLEITGFTFQIEGNNILIK